MKRETHRHPKTFELMAQLNCSRPEALGLLELLWDFAKDHAPRGDIGKWPDGAIARACDWAGPPDQFVKALVASKWLDRHELYRLVIHDWHVHAESWVRAKLMNAGGGGFVTEGDDPPTDHHVSTGRPPDRSGGQSGMNPIQEAGSVGDDPPTRPPTTRASRDQTKPNQTKPFTKPNQTMGGVGGGLGAKRLVLETLTDSARLRAWCFDNGLRTESDLLNAFGAAERAIEIGQKNPPGLFAKLVRERKWELITQAQEERARQRLRELHRQGEPALKATPGMSALADSVSQIVREVSPQ